LAFEAYTEVFTNFCYYIFFKLIYWHSQGAKGLCHHSLLDLALVVWGLQSFKHGK
jgi:hypothetical protein